MSDISNFEWRNVHNNLHVRVKHFRTPITDGPDNQDLANAGWEKGLQSLRDYLSEAESLDAPLRAVGSGWSLSEAAVCSDTMINAAPLDFHLLHLPPDWLHHQAKPGNYVFAQCGTTIAQLNETLEANGLALPTSGASNGQTIVGAAATGTHGAALKIGGIQDYIVGIHLLCGSNGEYWIERESDQVASQSLCDRLGAKLIRNNKLFDAAVVGLGSFGLIHAVMLRVDAKYYLERYRDFFAWETVRNCIGTLDLGGLPLPHPGVVPDHVEFEFSPYSIKSGTGVASMTVMYRHGARCEGLPAITGCLTSLYNALSFHWLDDLTDWLPWIIPPFINRTIRIAPEFASVHDCDTPGKMFGAIDLKAEIVMLSCEIGVRLEDALQTIDTLIDTAGAYPFPGAIGLRYVKRTPALLALNKYGVGHGSRFNQTCAVEMTALGSKRTLKFYQKAWKALDDAGIPHTFHVGKCNNLDKSGMRSKWGADVIEDWIAARRSVLATPQSRRLFSNEMLDRLGMAD